MTTKNYQVFIVLFLLQAFLFQACSKSFEIKEVPQKPTTEPDNSILSACEVGHSKSCQVLNGTGVQSCATDGTYMKCEVVKCNEGFTLTNEQCIAQLCKPHSVIACSALNGDGAKACLADGLGYEDCQMRTCHTGFYLQNGLCIATQPVSPAPTPAPTPSPPSSTPNFKIVNMGKLASKNSVTGTVVDYYWRRTDYLPQANELRLWSFTTETLSQLQTQGSISPSGTYTIGHTTSVAILGTTPSNINPAMYISENPGKLSEFQNATIPAGCGRLGTETVRIATIVSSNPAQTKLDLKASGISENSYCILKAETKYYVNTFTVETQTGNGLTPAINCSSPHCGYSFLAN